MNRTVKALAAAILTLGLAVAGLPLGAGGATTLGGTGCCRSAV